MTEEDIPHSDKSEVAQKAESQTVCLKISNSVQSAAAPTACSLSATHGLPTSSELAGQRIDGTTTERGTPSSPQSTSAKCPDSKTSTPKAPTDDFARQLTDIYGRLVMPSTCEDVWKKLLTSDERKANGDNFRAYIDKLRSWNGARLYGAVKGISLGRATLEVAFSLEYMSRLDYRLLKSELDKREGRPAKAPKPLSPDANALRNDISKAVVDEDLIIVYGDTMRAVFWRGDLVKTRWKDASKSWNFVLKLGKAAKRGRRLRPEEIEEDATTRTPTIRKSNLKRQKLLPEDLISLITVRDGLVYFNLGKRTIRVFDVGNKLQDIEDL